MVALFDMIIHTIAGVFIYVLKAVFSLLSWFLKAFLKAVKMLFVAVPVTAVAFVVLIAMSIFLLVNPVYPPPEMSSYLLSELFKWWIESVYIYRGSVAFILLIILTILMFVPVMTVFLCIVVVTSYGNVIFLAVVADAVLYLVRAVFGKSFTAQAFDRYYRLFPDLGRKHAERDYDKMLKKKNRQLEEELRHPKKKKRDFYEDDDDPEFEEQYGREDYEQYNEEQNYDDEDYEDEEYDDEYDDDEYSDDEYDDEYGDDEEYDEEYDDEDIYEDDDEYDRIEHNPNRSQVSAFDFFAGCKSRESVDKKYKSLVKLYHPDNMDGDTNALQEINVQYDKAKKRFS